jgi:hypothetical protein
MKKAFSELAAAQLSTQAVQRDRGPGSAHPRRDPAVMTPSAGHGSAITGCQLQAAPIPVLHG